MGVRGGGGVAVRVMEGWGERNERHREGNGSFTSAHETMCTPYHSSSSSLIPTELSSVDLSPSSSVLTASELISSCGRSRAQKA